MEKYYCFLKLTDGHKLWYGRHRNEDSIFQDNIFSGYKPNAYKLSKEQAEKVCENTGCEMELVF